jgi:ribonuclease P protein component
MASKGLKKDGQFRAVYRWGSREAGKKVVICYMKEGRDGVLPGFVASKKIGKANERNRAKRLMREIFRQLQERITEKNLWIVFIASFRPHETNYEELLEDIESSMTRAGLISTNG